MFDWLFGPSKLPKLPEETPKPLPLWSVMPSEQNFGLEKVKVSATSDGAVELDLNGYKVVVPPGLRHGFLDKVRTAVQMADVADPSHDQLNSAITK